jgi:cbb3-type cytochrome c oxidase subunit III
MRVDLRTVGRLKICVLLIFLAACLSVVYAQRAAQKRSKTESPQTRGRTLYMQNCARCHGADGRSQTEMGQLYDATDLTSASWWRDGHINNQRLTNSITNGKKGGMPAFGKKLSRADINALVAFVRTFKH